MSKGEIIKKLIKDSGLPITEIARRMDVDRRTVYSYMKKDNWKPETLQQISIACDKEANYLLKKILETSGLPDKNDSSKTSEKSPKYKTSANYIKDISLLNKENKRLLRKLVELQEKHIKLHEEILSLKKMNE